MQRSSAGLVRARVADAVPRFSIFGARFLCVWFECECDCVCAVAVSKMGNMRVPTGSAGVRRALSGWMDLSLLYHAYEVRVWVVNYQRLQSVMYTRTHAQHTNRALVRAHV